MSKQADREPSRADEDYQPRSWERVESTAELAAFEMESGWATSQREFARATSVGLAGQVRQAEQAAKNAAATVARTTEQARTWAESEHGPGRPPNFEQRAIEAAATLQAANEKLETARQRQERAHQAIRGIGQDYHPVNLKTGEPRSPAQVTEALEQHFATIATVADEASLPERCSSVSTTR